MSDELRGRVNELLGQAKKVIFGQDDLLDSIVAALVCEGHLLIEGLPGLGKTLSVSTMSKLCDLSFKRVQFTPDLLPSDLVGTMVYSQQREEFTTKFGPIFTQLLLADEINRSPAKVQAALLEAMAEKQVTIGDNTHKLSSPFVVLATQNPIEQEGTYPLPEAQLDRFMMKVSVEYPDFESELSILDLKDSGKSEISSIITTDDILEMRDEVAKVHVDKKMKDLIIKIVRGTRPGDENFSPDFKGLIQVGASPRAAIWLQKLGQFMAFLGGRDFVSPDDVLRVIPSVLGHRVLLTYEASIDNVYSRDLVLKIAHKMI